MGREWQDRRWWRNGSGRLSRPGRTRTVGLFGGSFNPAHHGHRHVSLAAMRALGLDELWWLVSPGNPLKAATGDMAPLAARFASAGRLARGTRIVATAIEATLGTRYTADTLAALRRRFPAHRFIWIMGADNLADFHRWRDWRRIAGALPIAVIARPGYMGRARFAPAMGWLRRFVRPGATARCWTTWSPPALVLLRFRPDPTSATGLRLANPDWYAQPTGPLRDRITRRPFPKE
jgi:nicotinate-nucleotide adenylyltransferase